MATTNFSHVVGIPVYCVGFTKDNDLILGGGGGSGASGVKNKIAIYRIDEANKALNLVVEKLLNKEEDAPMCMGIHPTEPSLACGINSAENKILAGENENCRVFQYSADHIEPTHRKCTLRSRDPEDYQKVTRFNRDGTLLATGGTDGVIAVLRFPTLTPAFAHNQFRGHEILDIDFSADSKTIAVISEQNLWILSAETGEVMEVITNPVLNQKKAFQFRSCRFGQGPAMSHVLYTVVNGSPKQRPFVCLWDMATWTRIRTMTVGPRPITATALSKDGKLLAFGSADMGIRICDSKTLKVLMTVPDAHGFPVTALSFNHDGSRLVSGSVDTSCRVIIVPKEFKQSNNYLLLVLAVVFVILALLIQWYQNMA